MAVLLVVCISCLLMVLAQTPGSVFLAPFTPVTPSNDSNLRGWRKWLADVSSCEPATTTGDAVATLDPLEGLVNEHQQQHETYSWDNDGQTADYIGLQADWQSLDDYDFREVLGEGTYAVVSRVVDKRDNKSYVAKVLKPIEFYRVEREIKIIQDLAGGPNIIHLAALARNETDGSVGLITEYVNDTSHDQLYPALDDYWVRFYMFQLLRAIEYAHSKNIFHRDIKPYNVVIDHSIRKLRLIDWGMADYYDRAYSYSTSVASQYWRAPEQLVGYRYYDLSSDMWSFGTMLAAIIFYSEPFFHGRHNEKNQLIEIAKVLGTDAMFKWIDKYSIQLPEDYDDMFGWYDRKGFGSFVPWKGQRERVDADALDLLDHVLLFDHRKRFTARQALNHRYFDSVREDATYHYEAYPY